jgi:hypothetical protein
MMALTGGLSHFELLLLLLLLLYTALLGLDLFFSYLILYTVVTAP